MTENTPGDAGGDTGGDAAEGTSGTAAGTAAPPAPEGAPTRYKLRFPDNWWTLDLNPNTRDASIRRRVEEQVGDTDIDPGVRDSLVRSTRRIAREAHARGALQAAGMVQPVDDGTLLSATTVVMRVLTPEDSTEDLQQLLVPVALKQAKNPLGQGTDANTVQSVDIPEVGPAGRVTSVEDLEFSAGNGVRMVLLHTVVPVPDSRDFLVISSATPNLSLSTEFFGVFDAIAGTLRFLP